MKKEGKAYARYLRGMELQTAGKTGAEIAELAGYRDASAWFSAKFYYARKDGSKETRGCAFDQGERCGALAVKHCAACAFFKSHEELVQSDLAACERISSLPREHRIYIEQKYYGRKSSWAGKEGKHDEKKSNCSQAL